MPEYIIEEEVIDNALTYGSHFLKGKKTHELVRCRDCKHYYEHSEEDMVYCINRSIFSGAKAKYAETEPDGYCAWGERREGECR